MTASLSAHLNSARLHLVARGLICKTESFKSAELHLRSTFRKFTCSCNDETSRNLEKVCNKNGIHLQQGYCWFNSLSFPKKDRQRWVHPSKRRLSYKMDFGKPAATHPELLVHVSINAGSKLEGDPGFANSSAWTKITQPDLSEYISSRVITHHLHTLHTNPYTRRHTLHGSLRSHQVCILCRLNPRHQCLSRGIKLKQWFGFKHKHKEKSRVSLD